jgi:hypothetical protein
MASSFEQLVQGLVKRAFGDALEAPIDPSVFHDPLALQIGWTPAKQGGAATRTHRYRVVGSERAEFRVAFGVRFLSLFVLAVGGSIGTYGALHREDPRWWVQILFGVVFVAAGIAIWLQCRSVVFDRQLGWYYEGRKPASPGGSRGILLSQIHALQIVGEYCSTGKGGTYRSFELNLVLKDGTRHNVIDHAAQLHVRADAHRLGQFLGVPVWDATL